MKRYSLLDRPILWPVTATCLCVTWAILFWQVVFVWISWELLGIPMGLAGALYFAIFTGPVLLCSAAYQFVSNMICQKMDLSPTKRYVVALAIPFVIIAVLLIVFCPMEADCSYLQYVFRNVIMN